MLSGIGLQGQYFDSVDLSGVPALVRTDADVDFDWVSGSPDAVISAEKFSVRWAGQVESNFTETHSFFVNASDGARLWVNGQLLIDEIDANAVNDATANINLIAGRRYDVQLEYREVTGDASVRLEWSSSSTPREVVPAAQLFAAERGSISVARFDGLSGGGVSDLSGDADFPNNPDSVATLGEFAAANHVGDSFGRRVHGMLHAPATGAYTFFIAADNQAELWLSNTIDAGQRTKIAEVTSAVAAQEFTASAEQQSAPVQLVAGQSYFIEVLHVDDTGADHLAVAWQLPGSGAIDIIPGTNLSPVLPTVKAYAQQPVISEGSASPARLTIVRSGAPLNAPLTVHYNVAGTAINGSDYQTLPGTVTIPAGQASVTVNVTPTPDAADNEGDETIEFTLRDAAGYEVGLKSERAVLVTLQDDHDAPAGGQTLWDGTNLGDFQRFGATFSTVNVSGVGDVIQAQIGSQPASEFHVQLPQAIDSPVAAGDILFLEFRVRSIGGPGQISAFFEQLSNFDKSLWKGIDVTTDWQRVQLPFTANSDYAIGEASGGFHLGFQAQTLQFTDLMLLNYGPPHWLAPETAFGLNNISGSWGTAQTVSVTGQPFAFAYQVETHTVPSQSWHLQAVERNEGPIDNGDTMRLNFWIRSVAGANPQARLMIARVNDSYSTLHGQNIPVTSNWVAHSIDVDADDDFGPNGLQVAFNVGYGLQTVEIGGFVWENIDNAVNLEDLPRQVATVSYGGRNGDDAWRTDADARIEAFRKSGVTVNVVDSANQSIDGAVVSLQQTRHDFRFGSAINAFGSKLDPNGNVTAQKYQSEIKRLFNTAVAENSHKWPQIISNEARALQLADFAEDNDIFLRGHVVVWPSRGNMPSSVWSEYDTREASDGTAAANAWLSTTIEAHLDYIVDTFRGRITEWDVVNEPFTNHDVMDLLGDDFVVDLYQRFRDADPDVDLALNDFQIFASNGNNTSHRTNFDSWLQRLSDASLLDVIGEQSHYGETNLTDIDILGQLITTYNTSYSAPVAITEFDINTKDLQLQADYLRDYLTMAFSQSGVSEFLHWGFWESSHWLPDAALYRSDFSIKPNGQAYEDLVFGNWWTDTTGTTRSGTVSTQAFIGQYDVLVQYDGQTYNATVEVDDSGTSNLTVILNDVVDITELDFGDAPDSYPTTLAEDGARHVATGPQLGAIRDSETDGMHSNLADADGSDEDGVMFGVIGVNGAMAAVNVLLENASAAKVDAWIDFNRDGDWDDVGEKILSDRSVNSAMTTLNYTLPAGLTAGDNYARVRLSSAGGLDSTGLAADGEVEDYVVNIVSPPQVESVVVNQGDPQRSGIKTVRVTFDNVVEIDWDNRDVFEFLNSETNQVAVDDHDNMIVDHTSGKTVVDVTFLPGSTVNAGGGLNDGNYQLRIDSTRVTMKSLELDGDENGSEGGDYIFGASAADKFYRKYGDYDASGTVGLTDFASFRQTFGEAEGQPGYLEGMDANSDGTVGLSDFAHFRQNFGT